jgi:BirA family biotin operon repressor/biotin-[acetyl-CoA-carboxylase] ligase
MRLLELLQGRPDAHFWPEALGRELGVTGRRVLRDLEELERFGFGLERLPHRGIRYDSPATRLCPDQIEWRLDTRTIGRRIAVWQRVTSTNDLAARAARSPSNNGLVILSEEQTAGRGRRRRRWHAPPQSSILMSVLLFPPPHARDVALLTCLAGVAVADVIHDWLGLPARIKWPNDVRVAGRKVCGILVEDIARGRRSRPGGVSEAAGGLAAATKSLPLQPVPPLPTNLLEAVVIGIGVNVNIEPQQFPAELATAAGSLMTLCGRRLDRSELARLLIRRLDHYYQAAVAGDASQIWQRWRELADLVGSSVRVERARDEISGRLVDLWPQRGMLIQTPAGELVQLAAEQILSVTERPA